MKMKLNFDQAKIKGFFAHHIEKLVLMGCLAALAWFVYGAISQDAYNQGPHDLQSKGNDAVKHINDQQFDHHGQRIAAELASAAYVDDQIKLRDYHAEAADSLSADAGALASRLRPFNPELWPQGLRRGEPRILPARQLQVGALNGAIAVLQEDEEDDEEGDDRRNRKAAETISEGASVVVITGIVPYTEQMAEYQRVFGDARFQEEDRDLPDFAGFSLERRELVGGEPGAWQPVDVPNAVKESKRWGDRPKEIVDTRWVDAALTGPLPPLLGRAWSEDLVSHPRIRPVEPEDDAAEPGQEKPAVDKPAEDNGPKFGGFGRDRAKDERNKPAPARNRPQKPREANAAPPTGRLFRFFDFDVVSGTQYQYRVKVWLHNPNFDVPIRFLTSPKLAASEFVSSEWSEPSGVNGVPNGKSILAGGVIPAKAGKEATAEAIVRIFSADTGRHLVKKLKMQRGQMADAEKTTVGGIDPDTGKPGTMSDVALETGFLLVDLRGGDDVATTPRENRASEPTELLIFDLQGRLMVKNQFADQPDYAQAEDELTGSTSSTSSRKPKNPLDKFGGGKTPKKNKPFDPLAP